MGMLARNVKADVNVIALVGERGREVVEFINRDLGEEGARRSVLVVATSDQPAMMRYKCPMTATAIAEYFCSQGKNVLLMMDSLTRFAMAQREIGLSTGEAPVARGYTPSIYAAMPKLLERTGNFETGSITGIYTVLVEVMTPMSRWQTRCEVSLTGTSCCPEKLLPKTIIQPLMCSTA